METILFYDVETSDMIKYGLPSEHPDQPHIAEIAAILVSAETRDVISSLNVMVKPDGWSMSKEATEVNGLTDQMLEDHGVPEYLAVSMLLSMWRNSATKRVAYNKTFDIRMIRIAAKRMGMTDEAIDLWSDKDANHDCAMRMYQLVHGGKNTKLVDAFESIMGEKYPSAHSALPDTYACAEVYFNCLDAAAESQPVTEGH